MKYGSQLVGGMEKANTRLGQAEGRKNNVDLIHPREYETQTMGKGRRTM
jgi:hypothetical protein